MRALLVVALGLLPGLVAAQGVGGAARREAGRRAQAPPAVAAERTYTNEDLQTESPTPEQDGDAAAAAPADRPGGSGTEIAMGVAAVEREARDRLREDLDRAAARRREKEQAWRRRFATARAKLEAARKEHDAVCLTGSVYLGGGWPKKARARVRAAQRKLAAAERALADLEEAARKKGIPPGWLR